MESSAVRLRVHFAPVGFEVVRVTKPMKALRADVALLLTYSLTDRARFHLDKILKLLKAEGIQTHVIQCDIGSTSEVVNEVGSIVTAAPQHEYCFNVSTGAKTACIAGTIAGMFWRVKPYYMAVDYDGKPVHFEDDFPVTGLPQFIPTFEIPLLDKSAVAALDVIASKPTPVSKSVLLSRLKELNVVAPRQKEAVTPQALQGQTDSILRKLEAWGFVDLLGRGKSLRIQLTDKGIEGRKMFLHMLTPRKPLGILSVT